MREYLIHSVEKKIRLKFPYKAKKILGGKSAKAQELLEEIFKSLKQEFDWSKNIVGNKVCLICIVLYRFIIVQICQINR